jgi:starch-binding outer membrane protein, SusD/RagB family
MKTKIMITGACMLLAAASCKKSFLERPSTSNATLDNFYNNAAEVNGATGLLYNQPWADWFDKAFTSVGDVLGGTVTGVNGNAQYNSFFNFNIQSTDGLVATTWKACYKAAGTASVLIKSFEQKKAVVSGNTAYLDQGITEARFIRGFAYFYIGRTFGDAPIIPDPLALTVPGKELVPRYFQKDVLRFALEDLKFAEANLPAVASQPGRVTKYAAKGLMAKIYLYLKDYANAKIKAKEVIDYANTSGVIGLYDDYNKMFTSSSANNNKESLFSLQWLTALGWDGGNRFQLYVGPQPLLAPAPTNGAGYSAVVPSLDMLDPATGYSVGDKRRQWSVMEQGFYKPEWKNESFPNGFKYDTTGGAGVTDNFHIFTSTRASMQKYIVGPNRTGEPVNTSSHSQINTYILRYADVLLIYAEAILGTAASTSDAAALTAYNAVHSRAGLPAVSTINIDEILHERKVEFAFEGDYWFDIQRQGFAKAKQMVEAQERGDYGINKELFTFKATLSSAAKLFLPIPQAETVADPLLLQPAIAYY